jgi:putative FmdB family regulatory protein
MPTYEFSCKSCGCLFEEMFCPVGKTKAKCPECGKDAKKIMSQNTFKLSWESWARDEKAGRVRDE